MAVVNTKSTIITLRDAGKIVPAYLSGAVRCQAAATVEVAASDDNNSVYKFLRVHSSWRAVSLEIFNDAITSGTVFDFGLWETEENGGAVVSQEFFVSDLTMATARTTSPGQMIFEAGDIADIEKRIWQRLGLAADPGKEYDLCAIGTTVGSGAGTISIQFAWVQDI